MPTPIAILDTTSGDTHRLPPSTLVYEMVPGHVARAGEWNGVARCRKGDLRRCSVGRLADVTPGEHVLIAEPGMESHVEGRTWLVTAEQREPELDDLEEPTRLVPLWESEVLACEEEDCGRNLQAEGLCATHLKRRQRGKQVSGPVRTAGPAGERLGLRLPADVLAALGSEPSTRAREVLTEWARKR